MTVSRETLRYIQTYNRDAESYNKSRKQLLKTAQKDTAAGRTAYTKLRKLYDKAMKSRREALRSIKTSASKTGNKRTA